MYDPTGGGNSGAKFDPTSGGIKMGGKKLDSSDLDDPAGGVKLIKGKDSFLTPPAGSW